MKLRAYRICQSQYASSAFDGEGARVNGGRWNSMGTPMVYTSSSVSLATLEILVHVEDIAIIHGRYTVIPIEFDSSLVREVKPRSLPAGWDNSAPIPETQILGDKWIAGRRSAVLEVPSAVTESESNFLLNPDHPGFAEVTVSVGFVFRPDPRL